MSAHSSSSATSNRGIFVSDLHLFTRRTQADFHAEAIHAAARTATTFVLGGDIFDFRWTTLHTIDATVEAGTDWLRQLALAHRQCQFHFVLGNHDHHAQFLPALAKLCTSVANLACHDYYLRLGFSLFLHGDVADRPMTQAMLDQRRRRGWRDEKRGQLPNLLYDLAVQARMHKLAASLKHSKQSAAQRILHYAEHIGHGPGSGLKNVYFGHTHMAMSNYEFGGLRFHNGGAPMKGLRFRIVETEY